MSEADAAFYGMDVYRAGVPLGGVVRPESVDALEAAVREAVAARRPIVVRGGGVSYTDAYAARDPDTLLIDTGALDRVIAIDETNMLVTVEPGISWAKLAEALAPRGLKVPFVGTFSGLAASVGGTVSQNANGIGSNAGGISAESVVAVDFLTGTGERVRTSTAGAAGSDTRFRHYGPDLTGLLTGDCGTLGVKTAITLKLVRTRTPFAAASFAFPDFAALHGAMAAAAAERIEEKSFGLDLALSQGQIGRQDTGTMLAMARQVWRTSPTVGAGVSALVRMGAAGTRVLAAAPYAAHYIVEGHSMIEARAKVMTLRGIMRGRGREIANSVPTIVRSLPFAPLHNMLGPAGERWVPLHGLFPHARVAGFHAAFTAFVDSRRAAMAAAKAHIGAMFSCIGTGIFLYEPALYWQDARTVFHERLMDPAYLAGLPRYPANPAGAALIEEIRTALVALMHAHGAAHLQIGKLYPYQDGRDPGALALLRAIKRELDPHNLLNPGALGL